MTQLGERPIPEGWDLVLENESYDSAMGREYTAIAYASQDETMVRIVEVQEPNSFGGWGFLVWVPGTNGEKLGLVDSLDEAQDIAFSFMEEHLPADAVQ